jgi:hypothetical protein
MSLTGNRTLHQSQYLISVTEAAAAEVAEGVYGTANTGEALALTEGYAEMGDWIYSANAEGRTGEVAVNGLDFDGEPGLIYSGPPGGAVGITVEEVDIAEGTIAPEATDSVTLAVMLNNTVVAFADEGFVSELDTETAAEMNCSTYVGGLQTGDVIRIALIGGGQETMDVDVTPGDVRLT